LADTHWLVAAVETGSDVAVGVEGLVEIAFAVEQADPGQGYARSLAALR
jgi:hypothetical protein